MKVPFLAGGSVYLRPLLEADLGEKYLGWLNDPEVNRFSQRRHSPTGEADMRAFFEKASRRDDLIVLAIVAKKGDIHVGNIQLGPIRWVTRQAGISILIGERKWWNQGIGAEAIDLVSSHAFTALNMHRLSAGTANPAFRSLMKKLGWKQEGVLKDDAFVEGKYADWYLYGKINPDHT